MPKQLITRRDFLKSASLTAIGGVLAACTPKPELGSTVRPTPSLSKPQYKLDLGGYIGPAPTTTAKVQLRYLRQIVTPTAEEWFKERYAEWAEAYPNITIKEEPVSYGDLNQKFTTYVGAGDPPDIMTGKGDFVASYAFNKIALPLNDYLSDEYIADLTPAIGSQQMIAGKLYAWPWEHGSVLCYFNKQHFEDAGIEMPPETSDLSEGWTWEQFYEACKKLSEKLSTKEEEFFPLFSSEYGGGGPGKSYWYEGIFIRSMGDPNAPEDSSLYKTYAGVSEDGLTASGYVDTPEAIEGMKFYQNFYKERLTPSVATLRMFEDQKSTFKFGSFGFSMRYRDVNQPDWYLKFKWGATPVPRGRNLFLHTSGDTPIISATSRYPVEAMAFMAFLNNDKNRIGWSKAWGALPARTSLFEKMGYTEEIDKLGIALVKAGHSTPITPGFLEYNSAMNRAIGDIALGTEVESRLSEVAKELDGLLSDYK
ncbi:MAG: substrate-binding domain-containing protein [Desulforhabdus sp.]|jgi:multiple sugar transport system substrate-binding protein|nr:substrate-binding domain-containing protein [Desulforhabdus sp.]